MVKLIPDNVNIDFIKYRQLVYGVSALIVLVSLLLFFTKGLNYGIDFRGGYAIEAQCPAPPNLTDLRKQLEKAYAGNISLQQMGANKQNLLIKLEQSKKKATTSSAASTSPARPPGLLDAVTAQDQESQEHVAVINKIKAVLGEGVTYRKVETIGPTVGEELIKNAIKAIVWALLAIAVYVALRFEWQFAVCGVIALAQDCLGLLGAFCLFRFEFNATAIVAVLTTASYSINDSIVIFDRIRENLKRHQKMPIHELINLSINETLSRTILTAGTTLLAILALCLFGGSVIASFSVPIFIGISLGTFSSIALSAPLLLFFKLNREKMADKGQEKAVHSG
jgi:preprotein translocase SecF subunit